MVEGASWQWIFWLNVPIGIVLLPIAWTRLTESRGPATSLDLPGLVLASVGLLGIVYGVVRGNDHGWTSATVLPPIVIGAALVAAFVAWELRAREPMLPMHLFRSRSFTMTNAASLLMFFGMFGSIFLLAQFLQVVQNYSPLQAGVRTLPWTGMPVFIAPVAGALSDRIGGLSLLATGLALQAIGLGWLAAVASPTVADTMVPAFVLAGVGMSLFFAPVANVVLSSVRRDQEGIASGANNAIRELAARAVQPPGSGNNDESLTATLGRSADPLNGAAWHPAAEKSEAQVSARPLRILSSMQKEWTQNGQETGRSGSGAKEAVRNRSRTLMDKLRVILRAAFSFPVMLAVWNVSAVVLLAERICPRLTSGGTFGTPNTCSSIIKCPTSIRIPSPSPVNPG